MLSTSENTISETINVSISVDTKKDQSIFHVLFLLMHNDVGRLRYGPRPRSFLRSSKKGMSSFIVVYSFPNSV